jgi:hypothetical protein
MARRTLLGTGYRGYSVDLQRFFVALTPTRDVCEAKMQRH